MKQRSIVHLDADAFFASVEQASDTRLRNRPIAVGGEKRGIIASASYEARRYGIYTPMPTVRARKLCPQLIIVPGDYEKYEQFSRWMFSYVYDFTPEVEICSIDEGYFDLSGTRKSPREIADTLHRAIHQSLKITVSEGIASNKLVSQVASKLKKPSTVLEVSPGYERRFLHPLSNRRMPGIGPATGMRMNAAGLTTIGHIAGTEVDFLALLVGSRAPQLREFAMGIDERPVVPARAAAKSYSMQRTFGEDVTDEEYVQAMLRHMADDLMMKVRADGRMIRTLTVKVRYNDFDEDQRSESLLEPTAEETELYGRLRIMLRAAWRRRVSLRLVSLRFSNLYEGCVPGELPLMADQQQRAARIRLGRAMDRVRDACGKHAVMRGHDLVLSRPPRPAIESTLSVKVSRIILPSPAQSYVPLRVRSWYSFMNSTLSPAAAVEQAVEHGCPGLALADHHNLHGAVPFFQSARKAGIKPVLGAELNVAGRPLLLYAATTEGYGTLCRLLSEPAPASLDVFGGMTTRGLVAVGADPSAAAYFPGAFYLGARHGKAARHLAQRTALPVVAAPPIHYARPQDRQHFNIVESIRTLSLLDQDHPDKLSRGALHFPSAAEMADRFKDWPAALTAGHEILERCCFDFDFKRLHFPAFTPPDGSSAEAFLESRVMEGLHRRYGARAPGLLTQIREELGMIHDVGYAEYFLVVWDLLQACREEGIEWITRGSAADSLVCYCLGISDVCPIRFKLYFRRFLNRERMEMNKLPDIDVDFPHDRKDDVVDLVFRKFGRHCTAVVGGFSTFKSRSALAEIAKVLGMSDMEVRRITKRLPWSRSRDLAEILKESIPHRDLPLDEEPVATAIQAAALLDKVPRYPKMHPCGLVLSRGAILDLVPCFTSAKGYPTTHFDMDAVEAVGLIKIDILAQGGLSVMRDVRDGLKGRGITVDLKALEPWEDPEVWEMIATGQARAVHHIESPAMISLARMIQVREIDTLVALVSVIRPGAANEQKKQRYARCHQGMQQPEYVHPSLEPVLAESYGLIIYEEQVLQCCEAFAQMPPGAADRLRRSLVKQDWDSVKALEPVFGDSARGVGRSEEEIQTVWEFITGFNGYSFCKAHSTAYGVEAYEAAWLKRYYPAEFMAAVLTHGKGFYRRIVYVLECLRLGIHMRPPSVNDPGPNYVVREGAIRVPVQQIKGVTGKMCERLVSERQKGRFESLRDFYVRVRPDDEELERLLRVGALDEFNSRRTALFWEVRWLHEGARHDKGFGERSLLPPPSTDRVPAVPLSEPDAHQKLEWEMELLGFTASAHPLDLYPDIHWASYCRVADLGDHIGEQVTCCGLVVEDRTAQQVTGELMKFMTLADHSGMVETELFAKGYKRYGLETVRYPVLEVLATVEPFENAKGYTLRIHKVSKPRQRQAPLSTPAKVS
jgi:DNA polymerase-3 subunit alpha/error-prone DNA polymerase